MSTNGNLLCLGICGAWHLRSVAPSSASCFSRISSRPTLKKVASRASFCSAQCSAKTTAILQADLFRSPTSPARKQASVWEPHDHPIASRLTIRGKHSLRAPKHVLVGQRPNTQRFVPKAMADLNTRPAPPIRAFTPGLPDTSNDFLNEQVSKQQKSNFHSTSLNKAVNMVANSVNKTALHPGGVE